jgi:uncharacterized protein (DUF1015 family)
MATIKPFGALRFTAENLEELVCPPYDIISEAERSAYLARNGHNIIRLELPREGDDPYAQAGETLRAWLKEGVLATDEKPGLYIYEEEFTALGQRMTIKGLTCRVKLEPFSAGVVLPHEETLSKAKTDRFNLMNATNCNFSAIYSLYFDENRSVAARIARLSSGAPDLEFGTADGILHRVWIVTDETETAALSAAFTDKKLYIADGHHRYETALNYKNHLQSQGEQVDDNHPASSVMMTLVDMENDGLVVFPTHRIVRGLAHFDREKLLADSVAYFDLEEVAAAAIVEKLGEAATAGRKAFVLYADSKATLMTLKDNAVMAELLPAGSPAYRQLDVNILHLLVLERLLGIDKENMANQKNLIYTRDPAEAIAAVDGGEADCAFLINPTRVNEIAAVAGAGEKMPQKSTYFYPKLITGHVMNPLF